MEEGLDSTRESRTGDGRLSRRPRLRLGAVLAIAIAAGVIAWLATRGGGESHPATTVPTGKIVPISARGLQTLVDALRRPIYWVGPKRGYRYELTQASEGRIYVRYLPPGVKVGSREPFLTIGTYAIPNALAVTKQIARESSSVRLAIGHGGVAFYSRSAPRNVYLAYPSSNYQVEVYDPSAAVAHRLVTSGQVAAVTSSGAAKLVSLAVLKAKARASGHPVYWAGRRRGVSYELTEASDGRIYIRYLPGGQKAGTNKPFVTIGTYPVRSAFAVVRGLARQSGSVSVPIGGGAIAFYSRARPTSVYVAFPDVDYQIEVYDPSAGRARQLVRSGRVTTIR
jgi:hypothetical protein